jgi:uncharacterized DUF497 family protein
VRGELAGKTGTTNKRRDSWFAGYAPERATVVWVGYDDNAPTGVGRVPVGAEPENRYTQNVEFEWDAAKEALNRQKHKVSFSEAATVFGDALAASAPDPDHSAGEQRSIIVGTSTRGRLLMVAHTERGDRIRIISARELTRAEREVYEEETSRYDPR